MKTIVYRGGVVRFRVPLDWVEEYEPNGGGTFYLAGSESGTLRLNVLAIEAPAGQMVNTESPAEILSSESAKYNAPIVPLREGVAMIKYDVPTTEQGRQLTIRFYRIAQALPPKNARIAMFSYTLLAEELNQPNRLADLEMIDREVANAELAPVLGATPPVKRPWWRLW